LLASAANSQQITADSSAAIQKIVMGSGPITKEEYDGFWNGLGATQEKDKERIISTMKESFFTIQKYQQEVWECAEKSWVDGKVEKCAKAKATLAKIKRVKSEQQTVMIKNLEKNMDNLLKASAARGEYSLEENPSVKMVLTLELIRATKASIDKMLKRFEQVLRVKY
jgi:hypothetical protein